MAIWWKSLFPWLKSEDATPPRKVSLLNVRDFPRSHYTVYWEIFVDRSGTKWWWTVKFYNYESQKKVQFADGKASTRDEADTAAQQWVLANIEKYRRSAT